MGFALLGGQIVFLVAVVVFIASFFYMSTLQSASTHQSLQTVRYNTQMQTKNSIAIQSATYDNDTSRTNILIQNTGTDIINLSRFDLYLDDERIARNHENLTTSLTVDTLNTNQFDAGDVLRFRYLRDLAVGTYTFTIASPTSQILSTTVEVTS